MAPPLREAPPPRLPDAADQLAARRQHHGLGGPLEHVVPRAGDHRPEHDQAGQEQDRPQHGLVLTEGIDDRLGSERLGEAGQAADQAE